MSRNSPVASLLHSLLSRAHQYVHGLQEARRGGGGPAALVGRL